MKKAERKRKNRRKRKEAARCLRRRQQRKVTDASGNLTVPVLTVERATPSRDECIDPLKIPAVKTVIKKTVEERSSATKTEADARGKKKSTAAIRVVFLTVTVILILLATLSVYLFSARHQGKLATVFGYAILSPETPSMEPTLPVGDYFLVEKVAPEDIRKGDIIVFYSDNPDIYNCLNTHRVVEDPIRLPDGSLEFVTQGDHNTAADRETAKGDRVVARYVRMLPALTSLHHAIQTTQFFWLGILLPALCILLFLSRDIFRILRESRQAKEKKEIGEEAIRAYLEEQEKAKK